MKDGHSDGQAGQSGHGVSFTHICVLGHRVQLKKQRALNYLAHLEEGENAHKCQGPSSPHPLVSAPACTSVSVYTCLWTWMSEGSGGPPVVYQPRNSSSLNTCLTGEEGARIFLETILP